MQSQSQQASLPLLTPLKYVEYHNSIVGSVNDEHMIINEESDKSDCESGEHELHKTPSKLPHKKRIAKKLNSNQPYNHQFSIMMPAEEPNLRNMQHATNVSSPHFECNICGMGILNQLEFFIHLKNHYEPTPMQMHDEKRKHLQQDGSEFENGEKMMMEHHDRHHHDEVVHSLPEKLIESLDDSREQIKDEVIQREPLPELDEFNEFSEPEDMMEDLRKEVEKVVETIDDECLPESTWNYQVTDDIEENDAQPDDLHMYSENLIQSTANSSIASHYDEMDQGDDDSQQNIIHQSADTRNFDSEDDNKPLEQLRLSLQKSSKSESENKKFQVEDDKEDLELTECLKKIHNFKCTSCNKAFNSRTALGYHLKTHTTERRYVCDQVRNHFQSVVDNFYFLLVVSVWKKVLDQWSAEGSSKTSHRRPALRMQVSRLWQVL